MGADGPAVRTPFLLPAEAARYLRVSERALENFRAIGGGPIFRRHGGRILYHIDELDAWSKDRRYADTGAVAGRIWPDDEAGAP